MFLFVWWCVRWSLAIVLFVAVMLGAGYYVYHEALTGGKHVEVPDVTMRPVTEASYLLAEGGLELGPQTQIPDDRVPKYYVIAQRPASGKVIRVGRKVSVTVSDGISLMVGSAITEASDPEKEYQECLLKADALISAIS